MSSKTQKSVEERFKRATNVLWKVWWFFVFILIIPALVTLVSFVIISFISNSYFSGDIYTISGLTFIVFMFSVLFFYRFFDRYRETPMFFNQENNLTSRIHILFLISIISLIVTPIFVLITLFSQLEYRFELLPLVSYIVLYNIIYFYFSLKPIDFFDSSERAFKPAMKLSLSIKQPYNYIIIINYVIQIIFLAFIFETQWSWIFGLVFNLLFYMLTSISTSRLRKSIRLAIKEDRNFMMDLSMFRRKFSITILSLDFILLLQIPFILMLFNVHNISYTLIDYLNAGMYAVLIILIYLKVRVYFLINYQKFLVRVA